MLWWWLDRGTVASNVLYHAWPPIRGQGRALGDSDARSEYSDRTPAEDISRCTHLEACLCPRTAWRAQLATRAINEKHARSTRSGRVRLQWNAISERPTKRAAMHGNSLPPSQHILSHATNQAAPLQLRLR